MNNIAIIGVGALGKRHLQSMIELQNDYNIFAVEVNPETVKQLSEEFPGVHFLTTIYELPTELNAAVISTNSNIRRLVFDDLTKQCKVTNIIFEKVLFQRENDFFFVHEKLNEMGINAWVNCARREWNSYQTLKEELSPCREIYLSATGGQWGLGCNGIHILDLVEFLSGQSVEMLDIGKLEKGIVEGKRKGFYEFYGTITGSAGRCKNFTISCINQSALPFRIEITTESSRYMIDEGHNFMLVSNAESEWEWNRRDFKQVYQSQMTGRVIKSIIEKGTCNLPVYESSMLLHLKLIRPLVDFFKLNGMEDDLCPIT